MAYEIDSITLNRNLTFYLKNKKDIDSKYRGKWILIFNQDVIDAFDDYGTCAMVGAENFGIGAGFATIPVVNI